MGVRFIHPRAESLRKGDEHPAYTALGTLCLYLTAVYSRALKEVEPDGLSIVFGGEDARVEEDEYNDEPVEPERLDHASTHLGAAAVQLLQPHPTRVPQTCPQHTD